VNVIKPLPEPRSEYEHAPNLATAPLPPEETRGTVEELPVGVGTIDPMPRGDDDGDDDIADVADPDRSPRTLSSEIGIRVIAALVAVAAWAVPGLGHVITRRWMRGLIFFACSGGLAIAGFLLRGNVFPQHSTDPFGTLGFLADASSGAFYFLARFFESAGPDVSRAAGDYGTRLIAAAGIVNLLGVFDAYEIALGRRA
jgi:hypothetical protein